MCETALFPRRVINQPVDIPIELDMSPNTAAVQLLQADTLVRRLPATLAAPEVGDIDTCA